MLWKMLFASLFLALSVPVQAGYYMGGSYIQIYYSNNGNWIDSSVGKGFQVRNTTSDAWSDATYPGSPYAYFAWRYEIGSTTYDGSYSDCSVSYVSDSSTNTSVWNCTSTNMTLVKTETFADSDRAVVTTYQVTNEGGSTITNFRFMRAHDTDTDAIPYSDYSTLNDWDPTRVWVEGAGATSNWTVAWAGCDANDEGGHNSGWTYDPDGTITDYNGASGDYSLNWRHRTASISAYSTHTFKGIFAFGSSPSDAYASYLAVRPTDCRPCDYDGDTYGSSSCGGSDCNDSYSAINPGASEACDGVDTDCSGGGVPASETDDDSDGYVECDITGSWYGGTITGGGDCHDDDWFSNPGVTTELCDGRDNDCTGGPDDDEFDDDGDGYIECEITSTWFGDEDWYGAGGWTPAGDEDCDDSEDGDEIYPGADEWCGGTDWDCDGYTDEDDSLDATKWYYDFDDDDYGLVDTFTFACLEPALYAADYGDCDDTDDTEYPGVTWYADVDDDTYGDPASSTSCERADSSDVLNDDDCAPDDRDTYPGADEICDGVPNPCGGTLPADEDDIDGDHYVECDWDVTTWKDAASGVTGGGDCDDSPGAHAVHPGADEYCNDIDDDCDELIDEDDAVDVATWYADTDNDDYGDPEVSDIDCDQPDGFVADDTDCDDERRRTYPGADERCNEIDDDCDDEVDEDHAVDAETWFLDLDEDTFGDADFSDVECYQPDGYVLDDTDCDDDEPTIYPGADEVCDGQANRCGTSLRGREIDDDGDGFVECDIDDGGWDGDVLKEGGDCDDDDELIHPDATEVCDDDDVDEDCDDASDDLDDAADGKITYWPDDDGDFFGDMSYAGFDYCDPPLTWTTEHTDCNDDAPFIYPGAEETPYDEVDQDCDGFDLCDDDEDGQNATTPETCGGTDCDDYDDTIYAGAVETWYDGVDQDCDGWSDFDSDFDGFDCEAEHVDCTGTDCDDTDDTVYPGAAELIDGIDNDCNGFAEDDDDDGDGIRSEDELLLGTDPFDGDSDGDGVSDGEELGDDLEDPLDSDGDGTYDIFDDDDDDDGIPTEDEIGDYDWTDPKDSPPDSDGDDTPDYLDTDSDDDGFSDEVEGDVDSDEDTIPDYLDPDSDDDGLPDVDELDQDADEDLFDDRVDDDDDNDGIPTEDELGDPADPVDTDGDETPDYLDDDSDGDGRLDADEGVEDLDGDGVANYLDADDFDGAGMQPEEIYKGGCATAPASAAGALVGLIALFRRQRRQV